MSVATTRTDIPGQPAAPAAEAVTTPERVEALVVGVEPATDLATDLATVTEDAAVTALTAVVDEQTAAEVASVLEAAVPAAVATVAAGAGLRAVAAGEWPTADGTDELPGVAGFIVSSFNPLVVEVARRALTAAYGEPPLPDTVGADTAVVVVSAYGDAVSARAVAEAVDGGSRVGPLMFFQSVPNAVAGYVASRWGLTGPVVAVSPADATASLAEGVEVARLLVADGDAARALVVVVEQEVGTGGDRGLAVLLEQAREQER